MMQHEFRKPLGVTTITLGLLMCVATANAQVSAPSGIERKYYQPLNQNMPLGTSAYWSGALGKASPPYFQPVRVDLPSEGRVTVYNGPARTPQTLAAGESFAYLVGQTYRFCIGGMPEFPGVELYPTVEVLDRLHPPPGQEMQYPVPLQFSEEEIAAVLDGRMVTKVVFLEQPQLAPPKEQTDRIDTLQFAPSVNLLAEADRVGRPMAILRLGSRVPWGGNTEPSFFGNGAPVYLAQDKPAETEPKQPEPDNTPATTPNP